jgi:hypothetical protein
MHAQLTQLQDQSQHLPDLQHTLVDAGTTMQELASTLESQLAEQQNALAEMGARRLSPPRTPRSRLTCRRWKSRSKHSTLL